MGPITELAAVIAAGHQPVYVDVDNTCTADPSYLTELVSRSSIAAFIFVQWAGNGKNLNAIEEICISLLWRLNFFHFLPIEQI